MIEQLPESHGKIIAFKFTGILRDADYETFTPAVEHVIAEHGSARILGVFEDFHGWTPKAAWDDFKFGIKHYNDIERIAMVGENRFEKWMTLLAKPFTHAQVKYFDIAELSTAWAWIAETS